MTPGLYDNFDYASMYDANPRIGSTPVSPVVINEPQNVTDTLRGLQTGGGTMGSYDVAGGGTTQPSAGTSIPTVEELMGLLNQDPTYQMFQANKAKGLADAAAMRREGIRQLVLQYGGIGGLKDSYGDVDPGTLDLASKNEFSQTKRVDKNYLEGVEAFKRALAGRGALQSGDLGYGLDQADFQKGQSLYDLGTQTTSAAQKLVNEYVGNENSWRMQEANAVMAALQNIARWWNPPSGGGGQRTAPQAAAPTANYTPYDPTYGASGGYWADKTGVPVGWDVSQWT